MSTETNGPKKYQVALAFEDGVTRFINCRQDETVADASYRQGINIPVGCRQGVCGTCKAHSESGEYDPGSYIDDAMTADEAARGYCLPCVMKPKSELVLRIRSTSAVARTQAATYKGRVASLDRLSPRIFRLAIEIPNRKDLAFLPGQYVSIGVPGTDQSRSYSFANGPDDEHLVFVIKLVANGVMSQYLTDRASVGDAISFTGPNGSFFLREADVPALLLAGGTGIAPIMAILRAMRASGATRKAHLIYGVSADSDVVGHDLLDRLASEVEQFSWDYCVSDKKSTAPHKGFVTSLIPPERLKDKDVAVYVCGPPPMVESVRKYFGENDIHPANFFYEKFALAGKAAKAAKAPAAAPAKAAAPEKAAAPAKAVGPAARAPVGTLGAEPGEAERARKIKGQPVAPPGSSAPVKPLDAESPLSFVPDARSIAGELVLPRADIAPLAGAAPAAEPAERAAAAPPPAAPPPPAERVAAAEPEAAEPTAVAEPTETVGAGGYIIGEEHPSVLHSDAVFDARMALELGALELTIGRLTHEQLTGYRMLAAATLRYVDGDRFVDAAAYTEVNGAFHDYLFTLTGNEHLLQAYKALGVKARMAEALRDATWCHPQEASDHVAIVAAFETGDKATARRLVAEHAEHSKETMKRAIRAAAARTRPAFISPGRFADTVVLVTGAAQGIGERTARRISAEGGTVVLADRSELVRDVAKELSNNGSAAHAVIADLETWEGAEAVVSEAVSRFGRIDVAIHNVGGTIWAKPFEHYTPAQIQAEINRSLFPTLWCCRAVLPQMYKQRHGTIVNVSSVATRSINRVPYAASKGGVNAITRALALEAASHGVRVVAAAPGGTEAPPRRVPRGPSPETPQEKQWYQEIVDQTVQTSLMHRYGTLDEEAAAITFLASREASYIDGTILPVAGGDQG